MDTDINALAIVQFAEVIGAAEERAPLLNGLLVPVIDDPHLRHCAVGMIVESLRVGTPDLANEYFELAIQGTPYVPPEVNSTPSGKRVAATGLTAANIGSYGGVHAVLVYNEGQWDHPWHLYESGP